MPADDSPSTPSSTSVRAASIEQLLRMLCDALPVGVGVATPDGRLAYSNEVLARMAGYPSAEASLGMTPREAVPEIAPVLEGIYHRVLHQGEAVRDIDIVGRTGPGGEKPGEWQGSYLPLRAPCGTVAGVGVVVTDVEARRAAERALRQSEEQMARARRMESIGRLAGGVAHDFNNLLTIILTACSFLREGATDPQMRADVSAVVDAAERARALTRQLLTFARRQIGKQQPVSLRALVERMASLLARVIGETIEFEATLAVPPEACVLGDESQVEQLVMNLVLNARDAMPAGGRLTITLEEAQAAPGAADRPEGPCLLLSVGDNGVGMSAETQGNLFEPFFTTKPVGQGTGLGLATCYGIVRQMGGSISCESQLGRGSVFRCYLPSCSQPPVAAPREDDEGLDPRGHETLLLVEDEAAVRQMAERALRELGYRVVAAHHGAEALRLVEEGREPFALVVTDLVMPVMGGHELAARLKAIRPSLPVLFTSGYVAASADLPADAAGRFLPKPYLPSQLARRVRALLDAAAAVARSA